MTANEANDGAKPRLRPIYAQMGPTNPADWAAQMRELIERAKVRIEASK